MGMLSGRGHSYVLLDLEVVRGLFRSKYRGIIVMVELNGGRPH